MGRPKKYKTPEECRAAARLYAKSHYDRNRTNILNTKKTKRAQIQCELETERAAERRLRQAQRKQREPACRNNIRSQNDDNQKERDRLFRESFKFVALLWIQEPSNPFVYRSIELTLEDLKARFLKVIHPTRRQYFDKLSIEIEDWIEANNRLRGTMHSINAQSPIVPAIKYVKSMLDEYQSIKDEYFYVLRNKTGAEWDWKRDECTAFKDVAGEILMALEDIEAAMKSGEFEERAIEGELLYQEVFPY
ncbi:hypothetical protein PQX77_005364 [Marasmius sp. AFHP31]|nr:hypothetical protein PQX77_005364 [Marasmius sp. AFHP31]